MTTFTGSKYDPGNLKTHNLDTRWIARGLSSILRYGGQRNLKWTVAHHVCLLVELLNNVEGVSSRVKLATLHHDDTEAIMGVDVPAPVKVLFPNIKVYEGELWNKVLKPWLGLGDLSNDDEAFIKAADEACRAVETLLFNALPGYALSSKQKADMALVFVQHLGPGYALKKHQVQIMDLRGFSPDMIEVDYLRKHCDLIHDQL